MFLRLFLTHLGVVLVGVLTMIGLAELLAPGFYQSHIERMVAALGPSGADLHGDLEAGLRSTLSTAMLTALPIATLIAAATAYVVSRRVSRSVGLLAEGSREIAQGNYNKRLPETERDELGTLAQHFNQMTQALQGVEKSRVELISSVAHELRTPLAALQGYAEALGDRVIPPEEAARQITREVRAMSRLVDDLSLVSRVEAGAVELHPQQVEVGQALSEAHQRFGAAFAEKGVALEMQGVQAAIWADPLRLQQIFSNLLSNALRYTPVGGQVSLGAELKTACVCCYVRDSGAGIAPQDQLRIFERFYRIDSARSRKDGGTGVGLTIAKGLVEAMGGRMGLQSHPGQGSTFWFSFPLMSD